MELNYSTVLSRTSGALRDRPATRLLQCVYENCTVCQIEQAIHHATYILIVTVLSLPSRSKPVLVSSGASLCVRTQMNATITLLPKFVPYSLCRMQLRQSCALARFCASLYPSDARTHYSSLSMSATYSPRAIFETAP